MKVVFIFFILLICLSTINGLEKMKANGEKITDLSEKKIMCRCDNYLFNAKNWKAISIGLFFSLLIQLSI
jgi:hypothetical protein